MENASKALIIAGAILLSILLISLGILIYSQAAGVANDTGMDEQSVDTFNNQFLQYEGDRVKGSVVKTLMNRISTSNASAANQEYQIEYTGVADRTNVNPNKYYTVKFEIKPGDNSTDPQAGRVYQCEITQNRT